MNKDVSTAPCSYHFLFFFLYHFHFSFYLLWKSESSGFLQGVQEADRPEEGFYIRSGITIIPEKVTFKDGTVI